MKRKKTQRGAKQKNKETKPKGKPDLYYDSQLSDEEPSPTRSVVFWNSMFELVSAHEKGDPEIE